MSIQIKPFLGPQPFEETDSSFFYGRDREVQEILALILSSSISLVYAKSGLGKTSIFNAKIIPELRKGDYNFQILPVIRFTTINAINDLREKSNDISNIYIFNILRSIIEKSTSKLENENILKENLEKKRLVDFLNEYKVSQKDESIDQYYIKLKILIFDQFEEFFNIYTYNRFQQQKNFFYQIKDAIDNDPTLRVIFIMREEFIAYLDTFSHILPDGFRRKFRLEPLREKSAINAVEKPLLQALFIEPRLKEIINEIDIKKISHKVVGNLLKTHVQVYGGKTEIVIGEFVEPVLLQVVCLKLWEKDILTRKIKNDIDNIEFGNVDNALIDFYDSAVIAAKENTKTREYDIREWCEKKLITSAGTRSLVYQDTSNTAGMSNKVVDVLQNKYLIRAEERAGSKWFELTHDRLINPIKDSNNNWSHEQRVKRSSRLVKVLIPAIAIGIVIFTLTNFYFFSSMPPMPNDINQDLSIPVLLSKSPSSIAINTLSNQIYIANKEIGSVSVIDGMTGNITREISVGDSPTSIAVNPNTNKIYLTNTASNTISVINGTDNLWIKDIHSGDSPTSIAVNPTTNKIYVANSFSDSIWVINGSNDEQITNEHGDISEVKVEAPYNLYVNPNTNQIYAINLDSNIFVINGTSNKIDGNLTNANIPNLVAFNPNSNLIYTVNNQSNSVIVTDNTINKAVMSIVLGDSPNGINGISVNPMTNFIYVQSVDKLFIIDGQTNVIRQVINLFENAPK